MITLGAVVRLGLANTQTSVIVLQYRPDTLTRTPQVMYGGLDT